MIKSAIVYLSLMGLMIGTGNVLEQKHLNPKRNIPFLYMFIPCLLYALVFGCRYGVGTDHLNYISDYVHGTDRDYEPLFSYIMLFFRNNGFHFAWFFGFIAFLQISLYVSSVKDRSLYLYLILIFFLGGRWLGWSNGIRQATACCFFMFSVQFIEERRPIPYLLCCLLAYLFHRSAIILLPFYFINRFDFFKIKWIPWAVYLIAIIISRTQFLNDFIGEYFTVVSEAFSYDESYTTEQALSKLEYNSNESSGLGSLVSIAITLISLSFIQPAKKYFNSAFFKIISNLYLIGLFGSVAFSGHVVLVRPFGYFSVFGGVIIAHLLYYSFKSNSKNKVWGLFLLMLELLTFVAIIYRGELNTAEYHFFWEFV